MDFLHFWWVYWQDTQVIIRKHNFGPLKPCLAACKNQIYHIKVLKLCCHLYSADVALHGSVFNVTQPNIFRILYINVQYHRKASGLRITLSSAKYLGFSLSFWCVWAQTKVLLVITRGRNAAPLCQILLILRPAHRSPDTKLRFVFFSWRGLRLFL